MIKATGVGTGNGSKRPWTDSEDAIVRDQYATKGASGIAITLSRTARAVWARAAQLDQVKRRGGNYHPYFRRVDSPIKAYVLGLLAADGYVEDDGHIGIELTVDDRSAVELVRDELRPAGSVHIYARSGGGTPRARFVVGSVGMARDLAALGIGPRKTRALAWPHELPQEFDNSFICGYFDGDGHIRTTPGLYWTVCSATAEFLAVMRERIGEATGVRTSRVYRQSSIWAISKYGVSVPTLDAWMHRDVPGLERKRLT